MATSPPARRPPRRGMTSAAPATIPAREQRAGPAARRRRRGSSSQASNVTGAATCGSTTLTLKRSPSRSASAAVAPPPAIDAAVHTTSRCSSATPSVVLVSARATALTRSTAALGRHVRVRVALHASIIRTVRPASADKSVTTAKQPGGHLGLLATGDPPDIRAWRTTTSVDASAVNTNGTASWRRVLSRPAPRVAVPAAVSEPTDMVRLSASAPMPPTVAHAAASGDTISSPPNAVATAFPPRNRAKTGHEWPMQAASPAAACAAGSAPDRRAMADGARTLGDVERESDRAGSGADRPKHVGRAHVAAAEVSDVETADRLADDQPEGHRPDQISRGAARHCSRVASHAATSSIPARHRATVRRRRATAGAGRSHRRRRRPSRSGTPRRSPASTSAATVPPNPAPTMRAPRHPGTASAALDHRVEDRRAHLVEVAQRPMAGRHQPAEGDDVRPPHRVGGLDRASRSRP